MRSRASWGHGDFHDLADLASWSARDLGADFVLVNPLHAAEPRRHHERLSERVCVPRRPRAGFERHTRALHERRIGRLKQRVDSYRSAEPVCRAFRGWL